MLVHCTNIHSITHEIAHLPHPWLPILTLKPHMRMSIRMLCGGEGPLLSASICLTHPAACVKYTYTNMKGDIWVIRWVMSVSMPDVQMRPNPFLSVWSRPGFLCLCVSQSKLRQVRHRQAGWKRKSSSLTKRKWSFEENVHQEVHTQCNRPRLLVPINMALQILINTRPQSIDTNFGEILTHWVFRSITHSQW